MGGVDAEGELAGGGDGVAVAVGGAEFVAGRWWPGRWRRFGDAAGVEDLDGAGAAVGLDGDFEVDVFADGFGLDFEGDVGLGRSSMTAGVSRLAAEGPRSMPLPWPEPVPPRSRHRNLHRRRGA